MADIPHPVIVLLVLIGAGFCLLVGWAIHSNFTRGSNGHLDPATLAEADRSQQQYMAEVRVRNQERLAQEYGWRR